MTSPEGHNISSLPSDLSAVTLALQALLTTAALEKSAIACLKLDQSAILGPFTELFVTAAGDSSVSVSELAPALVQLGNIHAMPPALSHDCLTAVVHHVKSTCKDYTAPAPASGSDAQRLTHLQASISHLASAANTKMTLRCSSLLQSRPALATLVHAMPHAQRSQAHPCRALLLP